MPIASGLAGGSSLNSFGVASRGFSWAARTAARRATPVIDQAASVAVGTVGYGVQLTGQTMRNVAGRTGAGIQSLARSWRDRHR
jgi:hypothetical protein